MLTEGEWMEQLQRSSLCAMASVRVATLGRPPCSINSSSHRSHNCQTDLSSPDLAMHSGEMVTLNYVSSPPNLCAPAFPQKRTAWNR